MTKSLDLPVSFDIKNLDTSQVEKEYKSFQDILKNYAQDQCMIDNYDNADKIEMAMEELEALFDGTWIAIQLPSDLPQTTSDRSKLIQVTHLSDILQERVVTSDSCLDRMEVRVRVE